MTNYQRYKNLLAKRDAIDALTKKLEDDVIFTVDGKASEDEIQRWAKLELKRRTVAVEVARQWQTLTSQERLILKQEYERR